MSDAYKTIDGINESTAKISDILEEVKEDPELYNELKSIMSNLPDKIYAGIAHNLDGDEIGGCWQAIPEGEPEYTKTSTVTQETNEFIEFHQKALDYMEEINIKQKIELRENYAAFDQSKIYSKSEVEALLKEQREACAKNALHEIDWLEDPTAEGIRDAILNAKIAIEGR